MKHEDYEKHPELLIEKCKEAIIQIISSKYDIVMQGQIIYIALAHSGKEVEMEWIEQACSCKEKELKIVKSL